MSAPVLKLLRSLPFLKPQTPISILRHYSTSPSRVSLYFCRARAIDRLRLLLRRRLPLPSPLDPFVAAHALRSAPSPSSALSLLRSLPPSPHTFRSLASSLALSRRLPDLLSLLDDAPFPVPPMDRLRWLSIAGDVDSALRVWESIRSHAAGSTRGHASTESYNLVMSMYIVKGMDPEAMRTFSRMVEEGAVPNSRSFTLVIEHMVRSGQVDDALKVFDRLPLMRVKRTTKQYNVLAEGLWGAGMVEELKRLIGDMRKDGIMAGRVMREVMLRLRKTGCAKGDEEFYGDLLPDERIGYVVGSSVDDSGDGEEEEDDDDRGDENSVVGGGGDNIKLRPWLDPSALASALSDWDPREVEELEAAKLVWTSRLVCKFLRAFKKADTAWKFFCWVAYQSEEFTHDRYTISRMITILARSGHDGLVDGLISKVKLEGIRLPFSTVRLIIDFYRISRKPEAALKVFRDASSICVHLSTLDCKLLCSSLLRTLSKCGRGDDAMNLLDKSISEGVFPDLQTLSGLMHFFAKEGDLETVHKLFGMGRQCGIEPDAFMYQVLIRAYLKHGRTALALRMFEDMRNLNLVPDAITKNLLVKSLWDEGRRREVVYVEERSESSGEGLPLALPGHVWTLSAADLSWVRSIYLKSFAKEG